jgi:AcrR family transcriptional regulator
MINTHLLIVNTMGRNSPAKTSTAETAPTTGRQPVQDRSRARQEHILGIAAELLTSGGSEHLRMSEVAKQAGISIGSLYQYFPDKAALMHSLAQKHFDASRACIEAAFAEAQDLPALRRAFEQLVDEYFEICAAEPVVREVWAGLQADPALREIELKESAACGALLAQALARVRPAGKDLSSASFLAWHLGEATVRLALGVPRAEGKRLLAAYKQMVTASLFEPA